MPYNDFIHKEVFHLNSEKITYIFLVFVSILMYNGLLIQRDTKLFEAYDKQFAKIKYDHPTLNEMNK